MSEQTSAIVSKVWGMCNPLRDDGVSYGDYLEQLTYLIFLKMKGQKPLLNNRNISAIHVRHVHTIFFAVEDVEEAG